MQQCSTKQRFTRGMLASPDRILVATDLTDLDFLLPHAIAQAKASGSHVTVVHAISPLYIASLDMAVIPCEDQSKVIRDVRMQLLDTMRRLYSEGIPSDTCVRVGCAADVIREQLRRPESTRLIMGTHGRGKLGQFALGSVAHELINVVDAPIFTVGPNARAGAGHATPRRVLHPVSFIGDYAENCRVVLDLAQTYRAELTLLHVLEQDATQRVNLARSIHWAQDTLNQLLPDSSDLSPVVHTRVLSGRVAEEILKTASHLGSDWIVLNTDKSTNGGHFKESRTFEVLAAAKCPVLTLGRSEQ